VVFALFPHAILFVRTQLGPSRCYRRSPPAKAVAYAGGEFSI
jgi:hypothetical protein